MLNLFIIQDDKKCFFKRKLIIKSCCFRIIVSKSGNTISIPFNRFQSAKKHWGKMAEKQPTLLYLRCFSKQVCSRRNN
ncbi:hypothetical protein IX38_09615 [Chryseobacterium luteum]|uniref:Uncharacterized protein n=1 Tax=Chryseobacterium luteum TaxID=421531 RepID=A0A085ZT98_9FLAO|nr:hypothetical protein IX38_09615 [Chryseobacterium luteum]